MSKTNRETTHPLISLTDFVDFVAKSGRPKQTLVKNVKYRGDYDPREDFWRRVRAEIVEYHEKGRTNKNVLDQVLEGLTHDQKKANYPEVIQAYKRFLGRKKIEWFSPSRGSWSSGGLTVNVNPELGLEINGERHLLKLYFKKDRLEKNKADLILLLMKQGLPAFAKSTNVGLLDVRRGKLYASTSPSPGLLPLLEGEAVSFATIWNRLTGNSFPGGSRQIA